MITHFSLPSVILFLPLVGALFLLFIRGDEKLVSKNSRHVALLITSCVFLLALNALFFYGKNPNEFLPKTEDVRLMQSGWHIGLDALSLIFVLMISFLTLLAVCVVRRHIPTFVREFLFLVLVAQSFMLIAVCARNAFQFFVFWQAGVLPLFLMIAVWGAEKRIFTAYKFCFSDLFGAVFLMPAFFILYTKTGSADFTDMAGVVLSPSDQNMILFCFVAALALKAPLFPFHAWLSDAQAEAPVPTGILLCGIFSKIIFYAFLRLALPVAGEAFAVWTPYLLGWAVFSALFGALITLKQEEMKKIAGFAHLTQVGFLAAGLFCAVPGALQGMVFLLAAQGLAITSYLMSSGALYHRFSAAGIKTPGGLMTLFPYLGAAFFLSCLAILAVPPLMPFTGQFLVFSAVFSQNKTAAVVLLLSVVLLYASFFKLFTRLLFGEPPEKKPISPDMSWREKIAAVLFGGLFLALSVMPEFVFELAQKAWAG